MADRHWVGSTGTWDTTSTTHWSATSGGSAGASNPGASDTAIFDTASGGGTVTMSAAGNIIIGALDMSTAAAMTLDGTAVLEVRGNVTFGVGVTYSDNNTLLLKGTGAQTLTSNGKGWGTAHGQNVLVQAGGGTYTLQDDYVDTGGYLQFASGGFAAGTHNVSIGQFTLDTSGTINITMGSGTWSIYNVDSSADGKAWRIGTHSGLTFDAGTSTIKMVNTSSRTFAGGGLTYYNLWNAPGAAALTLTITGANTFNDIKDDGSVAHTIIFPASTTTTTTTFHVSGNPSQLISLHSSSAGTPATLTSAAGTINCDYLEIMDSTATGATWNAGLTSTNTSGNTGWLFTAHTSIGMLMVF